jgi:putative transposase
MKFEFIDLHSSEFRVNKMCQALDVSRSAYYAWKKRGKSNRQKENEHLLKEIIQAYETGRRVYGSPRITDELRSKGFCCGENRIARLMRENNIQAKTKRKFRATTNSRHQFAVAPNLLNQDFSAAAPNQVWASDITYIWTREGWLYLAAILDIFSRQIVGWFTSNRLTRELVINALKRALWRRKPDSGLIFHSDQGIQYACDDFKELLDINQIIHSMSRKGNPYDNAIVETFFHSLKTELVYFENYYTRDQATQSIFEYIEVFYNRIRKHSALGYCSPVEFEQKQAKAA